MCRTGRERAARLSRRAHPDNQSRAPRPWRRADLLGEPERVLLGGLAVFVGGWTLEPAEAVCGGEPIPKQNVLDMLSKLGDKSLVVAQERGAAEWYRLLDPCARMRWRRYSAPSANSRHGSPPGTGMCPHLTDYR